MRRAWQVLAACLWLGAWAGVAQAGDDPDAWARRGREAAWADRNEEAAAAFARAIRAAPERRLEWLREYADQLTYSGRAAEAIPRYKEVLAAGAESPGERRRAHLGLALALSWAGRLEEAERLYGELAREDPADAEAVLGRARVLSWLDRNREAEALYRRVLAHEPERPEAQRELARVESWRGRQRRAAARLEGYLERFPRDGQAWETLARAWDWMGRPDRALGLLEAQEALLADRPAARAHRRELEHRLRPATRIDGRQSHQSDGLVIRVGYVEQAVELARGRTTVAPRYEVQHYDPEPGRGERSVVVHRPGLHLRHRLSDAVEVTAWAHLDRIEERGGPGDHTRPTFDTYLTWWPSDFLRLDAGARRTTFDNVRSLVGGIHATHASLSVDWLPDELTRVTLRGSRGEVSDGNGQWWGEAEVEYRLLHRPRLLVGWRATAFAFAEQLDHGYFNPETYLSHAVTARVYGPLGRTLGYEAGGSAGFEFVDPDGDKFIWSARAALSWRVRPHLSVQGRFDAFSSSTATSGGFNRRTAGAAVVYRW
ncbi:MAG: hypothetical protein Kow0092_32290 [Deferrisomatales bacterium]